MSIYMTIHVYVGVIPPNHGMSHSVVYNGGITPVYINNSDNPAN